MQLTNETALMDHLPRKNLDQYIISNIPNTCQISCRLLNQRWELKGVEDHNDYAMASNQGK